MTRVFSAMRRFRLLLFVLSFSLAAIPSVLIGQTGCPNLTGTLADHYGILGANLLTDSWAISDQSPTYTTTMSPNGVANAVTIQMAADCQVTLTLQQTIPAVTSADLRVYNTEFEILANLGTDWQYVSCIASVPNGPTNTAPNNLGNTCLTAMTAIPGQIFGWQDGTYVSSNTLSLNASVNISLDPAAGPVAGSLPGGTAVVTQILRAIGPLTITSTLLDQGAVGSDYYQQLTASGGTPPYTWGINGRLPSGLSISVDAIQGVPAGPGGEADFMLVVTDSTGNQASAPVSIFITGLASPENLTAHQVGNAGTHIDLNWSYFPAPNGPPVGGFYILRKAPTDTDWTNIATVPYGLQYSYSDTVSPYNTYSYEVEAFADGSDEISAPSGQADCYQLLLFTENGNSRMSAIFQPDALSLSGVASAYGYDHFNWVQNILYEDPDATLVRWDGVVLPPPTATSTITDPPYAPCSPTFASGWSYLLADCLPYYWNEPNPGNAGLFPDYLVLGYGGAPNSWVVNTPTALYFHDAPTVSNPLFDHASFLTTLVGVRDPVGAIPTRPASALASFIWSSNYSTRFLLPVGGVYSYNVTYSSPLFEPTENPIGNILSAEVISPDQLPSSARTALNQANVLLFGAPALLSQIPPPVTSAFVSGSSGLNGWYKGPTQISLFATDLGGPSNITSTSYSVDSGSLTTYTAPFGLGGDGIHTLQFSSIDKSGNAETPTKSLSVPIDQTPPTISGSRSPAPNAAGWNNSPVTASFQCADATSGLAPGNPPSPVTVFTQGANQSTTATCTDNAGNSATATVSGISIDQTAPSIVVATPTNGSIYTMNQVVNASYTCSDSGSGIATCNASIPSNGKLDTSSSGSKTFTVAAIDVAGNSATQTISYTVANNSCHYVTLGFSPITISRGGVDTFTGRVSACAATPQQIIEKFSLSGPLGPKSCAISSTVMFTSPQFTLSPGALNKISFPFVIPKTACAGSYAVTATTIIGGIAVDNTSANLNVK